MTALADPARTRASPAGAPRAIALAGPTASGKTAAALAVAQRHPTEIISVDSALVYRGMDVGTAKPSTAERAAVAHHLIDIRDPLQAYSVAEFAADASRLIGEINSRGKLALLVGGTMLYFKALWGGIDPMPPADPEIRRAIEHEAAASGWPALHAELALADPAAAARIKPRDAQRIQRALEVLRSSGRPISSFFTTDLVAVQDQWTKAFPLFSLEPAARSWLHDRIALRFDQMLENGLVDEVERLRVRGDLSPDLPSMRCVGYRQAWAALEGAIPKAELRERGIFATRQLAKRQLTWLRSMPRRQVIACDAPDALARLIAAVDQALAPHGDRAAAAR